MAENIISAALLLKQGGVFFSTMLCASSKIIRFLKSAFPPTVVHHKTLLPPRAHCSITVTSRHQASSFPLTPAVGLYSLRSWVGMIDFLKLLTSSYQLQPEILISLL